MCGVVGGARLAGVGSGAGAGVCGARRAGVWSGTGAGAGPCAQMSRLMRMRALSMAAVAALFAGRTRVFARACRTRRAGVCQRFHRRVLGLACLRVPVRQVCWNHLTAVSASAASWCHAVLAAKPRKGEPFRAAVFEACYVVLDSGVGPHVFVAVRGAAAEVGPVAPVAPVVGGEQRPLRALVQRLAPHDEPRVGRGPVLGRR